jgi:high-affinity Fe2+/Pb2+ permease
MRQLLLGCLVVAIVSILSYGVLCRWENNRRDKEAQSNVPASPRTFTNKYTGKTFFLYQSDLKMRQLPMSPHLYEGLLGCLVVAIVSILSYGVLCRWENNRRDKEAQLGNTKVHHRNGNTEDQ